ncbi:hypothetical protein RR48_01397 [Papilio machaon]|uniref:Vanin C-terminal domain-containing protein n=1 Tax=Papilio machaon TaxID=76193 RepID=A0A0N1IE60_PAPMA|nr:hypothetical protein RR48_01397 [Papilio machaon]
MHVQTLIKACNDNEVSVKYKAAVLPGNLRNGVKDYLAQIKEISNQNVDIVLLPSEVSNSETYGKADCTSDNYDEVFEYFVFTVQIKTLRKGGIKITRNQQYLDYLRMNVVDAREVFLLGARMGRVDRCNNTTTQKIGVKWKEFRVLSDECGAGSLILVHVPFPPFYYKERMGREVDLMEEGTHRKRIYPFLCVPSSVNWGRQRLCNCGCLWAAVASPFKRIQVTACSYTKPLNNYATCNVTSQKTFTTDFGVEFLILMEEDLLLQDLENLKNTKNIIITGDSADNEVYIKGNQLISSWAYISDVNVLSDDGIYIDKAGLKSKGRVMEINKNGKDKHITLSFNSIDIRDIPLEDTNEYIIRPLDLEASVSGYQDIVCDGSFCCQFYIKTRSLGAKATEAHYGLSVYSGVRRMGGQYIGVDSCKLVVCAALYKRTCVLGLESNMDVIFEKISIKGNFTAHHSSQFPVILTTQTSMSSDSFSFVKKLTKDIKKCQPSCQMLKIY